MLAGAVQQYLKAAGLSPVYVGGFGDYTTAGAPALAVHAEGGPDVGMGDHATYDARLQLRSRAANQPAAEEAARMGFDLILAASGQTLGWVSPVGGPARQYRIDGVRAVQRPTWFPTPEPGEETSCNFQLVVTEP